MNKYIDLLLKKQTGNLLALSIVILFGILSVARLYPFENAIEETRNSIDDWSRYVTIAADIRENGLLIPSIMENYSSPAGFLYNYFIALNFYLFGENIIPIVIIQNLMLGLSVAMIYLAFRDKMQKLTSIFFLLTLFLFAFVDIYKYYTFRLLSENLALFAISAFFYCFIRGSEKNKLSLIILSAVFLGLSVLTRPNIFPFELLLIGIVSYYYLYLKKDRIGKLTILLFLLTLLLSTSLLALRNYFTCGGFAFLPTQGVSLVGQEEFSLPYYFKKIIFIFGFLSPLEPEYQWRPHWTIMWLGYFIYLFLRVKEKRKFELWEMTTHLYIFSFCFLLILIAPKIGSYGFRLLVPVIFTVLPFTFIAFDKLQQVKIKGLQ